MAVDGGREARPRRRRRRSSRATAVSTANRRPMRSTASATRSGSSGSRAERVAGVDQAEAAGPGAPLAVEHEGGGAVGPAVEDVGAAGLLAHGDQLEVAHGALELEVARTHPGRRPQPGRACAGADSMAVVHAGLDQAVPDDGWPVAQLDRPRCRRRLTAETVVGRVAPHHVVALDGPRPPALDGRGATTASTTSAMVDVDALGGQRGDALVGDAAGHDVVELGQVGVDVEGEAVHRPARG